MAVSSASTRRPAFRVVIAGHSCGTGCLASLSRLSFSGCERGQAPVTRRCRLLKAAVHLQMSNGSKVSTKPGGNSQVLERLCDLRYRSRTEQNYVCTIHWQIRWHGLRHPREVGRREVGAFSDVPSAWSTAHRRLSFPVPVSEVGCRQGAADEVPLGLVTTLLFQIGKRLL